MLVPKLRFKREDGTDFPEWEEKRIGEILTLCHGKDYKHLKKGDIPVIGTGGVITYVNEALCDWQCVCIGRKGTIDRPYFMDKPFWSVDTLFYSKPLGDNMPKFQYYLFQNINWLFYNEASGVPSLSASTIENIIVKVPTVEEQQKIADFLSTVDEVIAQSEAEVANLQQQKKAAMQKIFSQEVRFKREDGTSYPEWEEKKVRDCCDVFIDGDWIESKDQSEEGVWLIQTGNVGNGVFISKEDRMKFVSNETFERLKCHEVFSGDILISRLPDPAGRACIVPEAKRRMITAVDCTIVRTNSKVLFSIFLAQFYQAHSHFKYVKGLLAGGTRKRIGRTNLEAEIIPIPCLEEQQKIADFLATYDEAISCAKQELDKWKELKKGLLQQMFV